jgi:hypothetical protein
LIIRNSHHVIKQMICFIDIEIRIFNIIHIILKSISWYISSISWNKCSSRLCSSKSNFIIRTMNFWLIMEEKFLERIISINSWILSSFCSIKCCMIFMISFFKMIIYRCWSIWIWILLFFRDSVVIVI